MSKINLIETFTIVIDKWITSDNKRVYITKEVSMEALVNAYLQVKNLPVVDTDVYIYRKNDASVVSICPITKSGDDV